MEDVGGGLGRPQFTGSIDSSDYWSDPEARHAQHRRHVRNLLVALAVIAVLAVVVHPSLAAIAVLLLPFLVLELVMVRRSRPSVASPDYRPAATVELDEH